MKYLKFYDLEETYINEKSLLEYFNVSYTKDTDKTWIKEEEPYLLMKFKVEEAIINDAPPSSPASYSINTTYDSSGSDYSRWMKTSNYYLGKYNWILQEI